MEPLDSILTLLSQAEGGAALLHANKAPVMLTQHGQTPMPVPPLGSEQMREIVAALVPASLEPQLEQEGSVQFVAPGQGNRQALAVTAIGRGEEAWLELRLSPAQEVFPAAAAPAQVTPVSAGRRRMVSAADVNALIARVAERGDAALFLQSDVVPAIKVDGTVEWLDEFEPIAPDDLTRVIAELAAAASTPAADAVLRWRIEDAAVVECRVTTSGARAEAALTITSAQPVAAAHRGLPASLADTCRDDFGLVVVAGSDARGVSRTCHSLIDLVNRERAHHVIVLESDSVTRHPRRSGYVSQRVVEGDDDAWLRAIERAVSEEPDVLTIDHVPPWRALEPLLAFAAHGLVIVQSGAPSALAALEGLVADVPASSRRVALGHVADALAAAVGQREIKRRGGGAAVSAYELIPGTPAVRELVTESAFENLALALERGVDGMVSMATAVTVLMRTGRISARQAGVAVPGLVGAPEAAGRGDEPVVAAAAHQPLEAVGEPVDLSAMLASIAEGDA